MSFLRSLSRAVAFSAAIAGSLFAGESSEPALSRAKEALRALPMRFEASSDRRNPLVKFSARASGYRVSLTSREALLSFEGQELRIGLAQSNPAPRIEGAGALPSKANYFLGNQKQNWRTGVAQYSRVRYAQVYPGIDLVYYGNQNQLEYDFVLQPGADPRRIQLQFQGAQGLSLTPDGDLRLDLGGGELVQKKPLVYQQADDSGRLREVAGHYKLLGQNLAGIELGAYDRSLPVTIDPLLYSSLFGAGAQDEITSMKIDKAGIVYATGFLGSSDLSGTDGAYQPASAGGQDIFVAKIDPSQSGAASLLYLTYIGGTGTEVPNGMAIDSAGRVYLTGWTNSVDFPPAGNTYATGLNGGTGQDAFVLLLDPSIQDPTALVYSTYLGGTGKDAGIGVGTDGTGVIYVVGTTESRDFPMAGTPFQNALWGSRDAFIAKIDPGQATPALTLAYSSYIGGEDDDDARGIVVAGRNQIWITGATLSSGYPTTGNGFQTTYQGGGDAFVTHLDLSRDGYDALIYSTFIGGTGDDEAEALTIDPAGNVLVTGFTLSSDFPTTINAFKLSQGGNGNAFLVRLNPANSGLSALTYSSYFGGTGGDVAYDVSTDAAGNAYLTGYTLSTDFPVTVGAMQNSSGGGLNAFIGKLNLAVPPGQALVYSTYVGGAGLTIGNGIATSPAGAIYVAGSTQELNFAVTGSAYQSSYGGGLADGFILIVRP